MYNNGDHPVRAVRHSSKAVWGICAHARNSSRRGGVGHKYNIILYYRVANSKRTEKRKRRTKCVIIVVVYIILLLLLLFWRYVFGRGIGRRSVRTL